MIHDSVHVLQVNNVLTTTPYVAPSFRIFSNGPFVEFLADNGLQVQYSNRWFARITLPGSMEGQVYGFCGNFDKNLLDDATTANGTFVRNSEDPGSLIGDSYVVPDAEEPNRTYVMILFYIVK